MSSIVEKLIKVRVSVDARTDTLHEELPDILTISVREKAQEGRANERVRELVAAHLAVPIDAVRIINGHHRPNKLLSIRT